MATITPAQRAYLMLGLVMLFWAGNSIVGRAVHDEIPPFTLALVRWTGALVLLCPFALRHMIAERAIITRHWRAILLLGLLGIAAFNALLYSGLRHTTAANALLLQALIPPLVLLLGALFFRDRASRAQIAGVALSTLGVVAIVFRSDPMAIIQLRFGQGDGLILIACLAWAIYTVCLRLRPPLHPASFLFMTFAIGALAMAPLSLGEMRMGATVAWGPPVLAAFAYVALFPSLIAYFLYNSAVAQIGAGAAGQTISLMPLFGALLAIFLLDEELQAYHIMGMVLILGGVTVAGWKQVRPA